MHRLAPARALAVGPAESQAARSALPIIPDGEGGVWTGLACGGILHLTGDGQLLEELDEELEVLATRDPLTGVANRRVFDDRLDLEWRRGVRGTHPLSVLMIDVDHFKRFNDALGHGAGDDCLRQVAQALGAHLQRAEDLLCRHGGEELAVILPDTSPEVALRHAELLRRAVRRLEIAHPDSLGGPWVTISIGAATASPTTDAARQRLVEASDRALYEAKRQGRNRCHGVVVTTGNRRHRGDEDEAGS